jgi:hypothetical protein
LLLPVEWGRLLGRLRSGHQCNLGERVKIGNIGIGDYHLTV